MARDYYSRTIATANDLTGVLTALAGVEVRVYAAGTTNLVQIYTTRGGSEQSPNPIVTEASGMAAFWAEVGEYDIEVTDQQVPPRIATTTYHWQALSAASGGIPSAKIAGDAGLPLAAAAPGMDRQFIPLGTVIDWWRPNLTPTMAIPDGFEICDGRTLTPDHSGSAGAGEHEFRDNSNQPINQNVALPDLRNAFIVGADSAKANGLNSAVGQGAAFAPGIGGSGGSNASKDLRHTHPLPSHTHGFAHTHGVPGVDHLHSPGTYFGGSHSHGGATAGSQPNWTTLNVTGPGAFAAARGNELHAHGINAESIGIGGTSGAADRSLATTTNSQSTATSDGPSAATIGNGTEASAADMRPHHYGMLKLMKCRRT